MEADCSQNGTHRATKDSFGEVPSHHPVEENMGSLCSLSLNWVNSTNGSFTEQLTSSQTSVNSNTAIDFEDMPFNYLANNTSSPDVLPPSQAETRKNNEPWGIPSCCSSAAASPPLIIQEAIISQNCKQNEDDVWCYNSFQYWRSPLPTINLSDILDLESKNAVADRDSSSIGLSEMET